MRLPRGEETLPFAEVEGRFLNLDELKAQHPKIHRQLLTAPTLTVSDNLLVERFRQRFAQGRVLTIYRAELSLTPEEQLARMEARDEIGLGLIEAERKLLEEELWLLRE